MSTPITSYYAVCLFGLELTQPHPEVIRLQQLSMERAVLTEQNIEKGILLNIEPNRENCCDWRLVSCYDGIVKTFVLQHEFSFGVGWLPHTVEYLHVVNAILDSALALERFPRNLRYCWLNNIKALNFDDQSSIESLNFAYLPPNLEEFFLVTLSYHFGTIYVPSLPKSLRMCAVWGIRLSSVMIASEKIPQSLEKMRFSGFKMKVQSIDTKKLDKRVQGVSENWAVARVLWMSAKGQYSLGQGLENKCARVQKAAVA